MSTPKNMPTETLRNMLELAKERADWWGREIERDKEQLSRAEAGFAHWTEERERLLADLREREQEEAKDG